MSAIKRWWQNFLNRLADANKQQFGNEPPSCCDGDVEGQKIRKGKSEVKKTATSR
jgi:hypothetical protein